VLLSLIPLALYARRRGDWVLPLSYIVFFAALPDFLHIGDLRVFSHSIVGAAIMLLGALFVLQWMHGWRPLLVAIAAISMASHLLADTYIGHIYPWWPWSLEMVQNNQFNTLFDIRTELELCAVAIVPVVSMVLAWPRAMRMDGLSRNDLLALIVILAPFTLFSLAQTAYYVELDMLKETVLSVELLLVAFLVIALASAVGLGLSIRRFGRGASIPKRISILPEEYYRR
jgi:hypothetical protein